MNSKDVPTEITEDDLQMLMLGQLDCQEMAAVVHDLIIDHRPSWHQGTWGQIFTNKITKFHKRKAKRNRYGEATGKMVQTTTCSTTGCVAGWVTQLAGDEMLVGEGPRRFGEEIQVGEVIDKRGTIHSISDRGAQLLCLSDRWLFEGDRTYDEVLFALEELAAGKQPSKTSWTALKKRKYKAERLRPRVTVQKKKVQHIKAEEATPQRETENIFDGG